MSISLLIAGDFCSIYPEQLKVGTKLREKLDFVNLRIVNFEGPLQRGICQSANGCYLSQSEKSPAWLIRNGFDIIELANNHALDFGEDGLRASKDAFCNAVTLGCGAGWEEAYKVSTVEIKGKKIGFLNATSADFSSLKDEWTEKNGYGCPWINHPSVPSIIMRAKSQCDYLVVLPHAGVEFMDVPLPEWRTIYRQFIDLGADAVVASHTHCPQGWEMYEGKPIFYSLGNFVFEKKKGGLPPHWNNGVLALMTFGDDGKIKASCFCSIYKDHLIDIDDSDVSRNYLKDICDVLIDKTAYLERVDRQVEKIAPKYEHWMMGSNGTVKVSPFTCKNLWHVIREIMYGKLNPKVYVHQMREESSRWMQIRKYKMNFKKDKHEEF